MAENQCLYTNVQLGFGNGKSQTIASIGCFLTSIQNGLKRKGYGLRFPTPVQYNEFCKQKDTFIGKIMLDAGRVKDTQKEYFLEGRREAWNDFYIVKYLNDPTYLILGEVSGKGIGGTGQHFVEIKKVDVRGDGRVTMVYIDDPWGGKEDMKVTDRYGKFGNILSLRVFKIVKAPVEEKTTITAIDNVNIRTAPRTNAPKATHTGTKVDGVLGVGDKIKNAILVKGDEVKGINGWWQSPKNRFVWSGGTDKERKV